ncbi:MAG: diadenylate cyclase CdaA [Oscillospiraceae bacterium]|jgi:diadenylate cyclase|nr:diadenylate cyclase CdaA [Oscillospiraceae bacterium]
MQQFWQNASSLLCSVISSPTIADIIDIIIVAFLIYKLMTWTRDTRASQVLKGLGMLFLAYWASDWLGFKALNWILQLVVNSGAVVIVVLFQSELRRALEQIGRAGSTRIDRIRARDHTRAQDGIISELVSALTNLSRRRVGALVVIEQRTGLNDVIGSGTRIDAEISAPLIENIFEPNTPLHDGAMIIRGYRIEAAACILTLSEDTGISRELGTRHRAALGISETTDSVTLIVSEETGIISMARDGRLTRHLDARSLRQVLENLYGREGSGGINLLALLLAKPKPVKRAKGKQKDSDKK